MTTRSMVNLSENGKKKLITRARKEYLVPKIQLTFSQIYTTLKINIKRDI